MSTTLLHQASMSADTLRRALQSTSSDWRTTYPILAALDVMSIKRSAQSLPDNCPHNAHDAYVLNAIGMPMDTGLAIAQAAVQGVISAIHDLQQRKHNPWFCLTPVHWQAGRDKVHLIALSDIDAQEAKLLLETIAPWLSEWTWQVEMSAPNQWFIRANAPFDYIAPSLNIATHDQLEYFLPHGEQLKRWQTLLTEIQMAWFNHPVNQARQAAHQLPINSVWLDNTSSAIDWTPSKVEQWQTLQAQIQNFSNRDIHTHLTELNAALAPTLTAINRSNTAKVTFLGDIWQQDIVFKKATLFERIRHKIYTHKPVALQWLITPQFDLSEK